MLNFDRSTVKHGTQNIQHDCHQWFSDSFIVHQIRFRPGLRPGLHRGSLQRFPDPPCSWFKGPYFYGEGRGGRAQRDRGRKGRDQPPFANSWIRPCIEPSVSPKTAEAVMKFSPKLSVHFSAVLRKFPRISTKIVVTDGGKHSAREEQSSNERPLIG